ncbi:hypothetical protein RsTz2092_09540 [Deferribacterales bacterium RsTz2092]|nr:hypothetical protein AGMMS49941_04920 [Deferribacterales bacterium]
MALGMSDFAGDRGTGVFVRQTNEVKTALYYVNNILSKILPLPLPCEDALLDWLEKSALRLIGMRRFNYVWHWDSNLELDIANASWQKIATLRKNASADKLPKNMDTMRKLIAKMGEHRKLKHDKKVQNIFDLFDIAPQNRNLLAFKIYADAMPLVASLFDHYVANRYLTGIEQWRCLANAVGVSLRDVKRSLSAESELITKGLLTQGTSVTDFFERVLKSNCKTAGAIKQFILGKSAKASLTSDQFDYMADDVNTIRAILSTSLKERTKGVNILLYGVPGTGKTELAKVLAGEVKAELYSVSENNPNGEKQERLAELALAQTVLRSDKETILLFDEAEDVFRPEKEQDPQKPHKQNSKLYFNRMLENNETPVFWISNNIEGLDKAYIRRFTYALHVKKPDEKALASIWRTSATKYQIHLADERIDELSKRYDIAPAIIDSALKTSALVKNSSVIERTIDSLQRASLGYVPNNQVGCIYVRQTNEAKAALYYINNLLNTPIPAELEHKLFAWLDKSALKLLGIQNFSNVWDSRGKAELDIANTSWESIATLAENRSEEHLPKNIETMRKLIAKMAVPSHIKHDKKVQNIFVLFGVAPQHKELLAFTIYTITLPMVQDIYNCIVGDSMAEHRYYEFIANLVGVSVDSVKQSLSSKSELKTGGLLNDIHHIQVSDFFDRVIKSPCHSISEIKRFILGKPAKATLSVNHFDYIAKEVGNAKSILSAALKKRMRGVNILLYGVPGTGKTELTKALAHELGAELYSLSEESTEGNQHERLGELAIAQNVLRTDKNTLLLFDEAEDAFYQNPFVSHKYDAKVFFNRMLENNETPVIWISNNIKWVDKAYIRRFTYALKMKKPDERALASIWKSSAKKHSVHLADERIDELSKRYDIAPAIIDSALKASVLMDSQEGIEQTINALQKASLGHSPKSKKEGDVQFTSELLNCSTDLEQLARQLTSGKVKPFSMCLYGAPGTGKSAYARYLAEKLNMRVLHKRASDLLGMYVGETEKNIAEAFSDALEDNKLLIFDEADSFLHDRRDAQRSWEVSRVNEMLTQMESHPLPFVCTTNLMDGLDSASLRRFTFKVKYNYLKTAQVAVAFKHFFGSDCDVSLKGLDYLAPGDFAVVANKADIMQITQHSELVEMLREEQRAKSKDIVDFNKTYIL